jgi:hypothetical protein
MLKLDSFKTNRGLIIILIVGLIVGFVAGMEYKAYQVRNAVYDSLGNLSNSLSQTSETAVEEEPVVVNKSIGQDIELATIKFRVNDVKEQQIVSSKYGSPEVASKDAKFVVIDVDVINITSEPFYFQADGFVVVDNLDRIFNPYGHTIGNIDNYLEMRELSPSIMENGKVVFEIPSDAVSYTLNIGKAGTNELYVVTLK